MENKTFGEFLQEKRKEKKITQHDLADALYVTDSAVSKWEKNVARPDISLLPKLSEILGVSEHELITASIDTKDRKVKHDAKKWRILTSTFNLTFLISYGIAILTCFICNIAVFHTLDWFFIVCAAILLAATFTTIPQFITKFKLLLIPLSELLALIILIIVCAIYTNGDWALVAIAPIILGYIMVFLPITIYVYKVKYLYKFNAIFSLVVDSLLLIAMLAVIDVYVKDYNVIKIALPTIAIWLALPLGFILIITLVKLNKMTKSGILLGFSALYFIIAYPLYDKFLNHVLETKSDQIGFPDFSNWSEDNVNSNVNFIIFLSLLITGIILTIIGVLKNKKKIDN